MAEIAHGIDAVLALAGERDVHTDWTEPSNFIAAARRAVARSLSSAPGQLLSTRQSLIEAIEQVKPQRIVSVLPFDQASALAGKGAADVATELIEDFTAEWAADQLASSKAGMGDARIISAAEGVHLAATLGRREEMARKLVQTLRVRPADPAVFREFEELLRWASMSTQQRTQKLMQTTQFSDVLFHCLLEHLKELLRAGGEEQAVDIAAHYFSFLQLFPDQMELRDIERSPQLLLLFSGKPGGALQKRLVQLFVQQFKQTAPQAAAHAALARCIPALGELAARVDDFATAAALGAELESWTKQNKALHRSCCDAALSAFLSVQVCNRLVEIFLDKRNDSAAKQSTTLLRMSGGTGAEAVLSRLEHEDSASQRRALMRLLGLLGNDAIPPARKRLTSDKWYVVRNICSILSDLKDPEMSAYFKPALCHRDPRVQQAAFTALTKSRSAGRAQLMAESLPYLSKHLMEPVLEELTFAKDPACLPALEEFAFQQAENDKIKPRLQQVIRACQSAAASA